MAASEGQLALEFVRTLSEEAAAHRAYLQLLYGVTIGALLAGLAGTAVFIGWMWQRSLRLVREAVEDEFKTRIGSLFEIHQIEADRARERFSQDLKELQSFRNSAKLELDAIAALASEAKLAAKGDKKDAPNLGYDSPIVISKQKWIAEAVLAEYGSVVQNYEYTGPDGQLISPAKPQSIIIDVDVVDISEVRRLIDEYKLRERAIPVIIVVNKLTLLSKLDTIREYISGRDVKYHLVDGLASLISLIRGIS